MQSAQGLSVQAGLPAALLRAQRPVDQNRLLPRDVAFLTGYGFAAGTLKAAHERAVALGVPAADVLVASGSLTEAVYVRLLARHLGITPTFDARPDPRVQLQAALTQGWFRGNLADGRPALVVAVGGRVADVLLSAGLSQHRAHLALTGQRDFQTMLHRHFAGEIALSASQSVPAAESARTGLTLRQQGWLGGAVLTLAGLTALSPDGVVMFLPLLLGLLFLCSAVLQLVTCARGFKVLQPAIERRDAALPRYSVLVPLHREADVVADLVAALTAIDYPAEKLQILLVVEAHDQATRVAIEALDLPPYIAAFVAPPGTPHTKPRALNAAMPFVTGDYVVVYDAEDRPEPDQLRAAAALFQRVPETTVCLQARLAIDNTEDSWLTQLFTMEYAALFDVIKAGTAHMGLPVPLGGTSNHFRTEALRRLGAWDAWNVTEDADLGFRLALHQLDVEDLNSTTFEEAPITMRAWMHQRSRWLKGWMQTIITHSRSPVLALRRLGPLRFFAAIAQSAGVIVGALGAPLFHLLVVRRLLSPEPFGAGSGWHVLADSIMIVLAVFGTLAVFAPAVLGIIRRRHWRLLLWLPLLPVYQLLVSIAAYKAAWELVRAPHVWNKTRHGLARKSRMRSAGQTSGA